MISRNEACACLPKRDQSSGRSTAAGFCFFLPSPSRRQTSTPFVCRRCISGLAAQFRAGAKRRLHDSSCSRDPIPRSRLPATDRGNKQHTSDFTHPDRIGDDETLDLILIHPSDHPPGWRLPLWTSATSQAISASTSPSSRPWLPSRPPILSLKSSRPLLPRRMSSTPSMRRSCGPTSSWRMLFAAPSHGRRPPRRRPRRP